MDLLILDKELEPVGIIDSYESFIWTERYNKYGDFELYSAVTSDILELMKPDYYVVINGSDRAMIIEKVLIECDAEEGDHATVSGRSLESILDRRVVLAQTRVDGKIICGPKTLSGMLDEVILTLINECIVNPLDGRRKIDIFEYERTTNDPTISSIKVDMQCTGDNLYDVIAKLCEEHKVGFRVVLTDDNKFRFKLYTGVDRSYEQTANSFVLFSPSMDNLISGKYLESTAAYKNAAYIGGQGQDTDRTYAYAYARQKDYLYRREMFVDARDLANAGDGNYDAQLQQRGKEKLAETSDISAFEGEVDATMYEYRVDYNLGDIVQLSDDYGHDEAVRVVETVISDGEGGYLVYPTFESIEEKGVQST